MFILSSVISALWLTDTCIIITTNVRLVLSLLLPLPSPLHSNIKHISPLHQPGFPIHPNFWVCPSPLHSLHYFYSGQSHCWGWGRRREGQTTPETENQLEPNTHFCTDRKTETGKWCIYRKRIANINKMWEIMISSPQLGQESPDITLLSFQTFDLIWKEQSIKLICR